MSAMSYLIRDTTTGQYLHETLEGYVWQQGKKGCAMFSLDTARKMSQQLQKAGFGSLKMYTVTGGIQQG